MEYISNQIKDITGYPPADFKDNATRSFTSVIHPEDVEMVAKRAIEDSIKDHTHYEMEYRSLHQNGNV
jgi:two-component system, sensor histidine kinase and response regulator